MIGSVFIGFLVHVYSIAERPVLPCTARLLGEIGQTIAVRTGQCIPPEGQGKKPLAKEWLRPGNVSETSGVSSAGGFKPIRKMKRMMTPTARVAGENDGLQ
jgi:hypothetical protein